MLPPLLQRKRRSSVSPVHVARNDEVVYAITHSPAVQAVAKLVTLSHRRVVDGHYRGAHARVLMCSAQSDTAASTTPTMATKSLSSSPPPSFSSSTSSSSASASSSSSASASATPQPARAPAAADRSGKDQSMTSQKQFASLLAGGIAGALSATLTCPIEVVKTHLQASKGVSAVALAAKGPFSVARNIARVEGVRGFFRGLTPTLIGILPARATFFWAYATTKGTLSQRWGDHPIVHVLSAAAAGVTSNTLTNPIWLMKSRVQLQAGASSGNPMVYRGYRDAVYRIMREEGLGGFFKGLTASYWGVTEGAIQFVVYEGIKKRIVERNRTRLAELEKAQQIELQMHHSHSSTTPTTSDKVIGEGEGTTSGTATRSQLKQVKPINYNNNNNVDPEQLSTIQYLTAAAFSKLVASIATYPHEVVRLRMREQPRFVGAAPKYTGMIQSLQLIAREEGRKGLYAGMGTHLARVVPNAALMFFTYEVVVKWIEKQQQQQAPSSLSNKESPPPSSAKSV